MTRTGGSRAPRQVTLRAVAHELLETPAAVSAAVAASRGNLVTAAGARGSMLRGVVEERCRRAVKGDQYHALPLNFLPHHRLVHIPR